ncbi:hypothetical protein LCGC14_1240310 [marine sediment metagenome]|uniref:Uncharacterized protein n=1 Tax=marine sediment metagenome TaxID=412755 RepID=A0A0F9LT96_9ZZZZ
MPYIKKEERPAIDAHVEALAKLLNTMSRKEPLELMGRANYTITTLLLKLFDQRKYAHMSCARAVVSDVKEEWYRRRMVPYEEEKIEENGDVY